MAMQPQTMAQARNGFPRRAGSLQRFVLVVCLLFAALPAQAIDSRKTAVALAHQAAKAFEAGEMDRAAQAYLEAWHTDSSEPNYLYGAARAEQSAGQRERAEEHYRQFVAMANAEPARVSKAKAYLNEFAGMRSDEKVQAAERAEKRGEWRVATAAYSEAWRLREDRLALLLRSARAAKEDGDNKQAEASLRTYLARAPGNAPDRGEAQAMLDALAGKPVVVTPMEPAAASEPLRVAPELVPTVTEPARPMSNRRIAGWWTLGSGAAIAVTGAALIVLGKSAEAQFNQDLGYDGTVVHGDLTYGQATSRAAWIGSLQTTGVTMLGVGVAVAGVGAALVLTSPESKVALVPDWHGFALAGRF